MSKIPNSLMATSRLKVPAPYLYVAIGAASLDLFGRGYSAAPCPETHDYDSSLYMSQILLCLQSSPISWSPFTIVGYSLGGALGADFTSYFPALIKGLVLVAPGGLIRDKHISFSSKLLYQTPSLLPETLVEKLVAKRLWTGSKPTSNSNNNNAVEPQPGSVENAETTTTTTTTTARPSSSSSSKDKSTNAAVYLSSTHLLLPHNPASTVSAVVDWQLTHHAGFVPAFISTIRHAPIHNQHARWRAIREHIEKKNTELKRVWMVLGETDPIIIADELLEDAVGVLGEEIARWRVLEGVGHEVGVENADDIVDVVVRKVLGKKVKSTRAGRARSHHG
ncbi:hypothetical protein N0V83_002884 [Neocucurbitaria cava]|uniref:AB hydrolase-1 domain-containing protein n=1 Tax=Neocucurbitaria cava TaxID=798079 RepID=A0A9W8YDI6_9PLEO|nr:hypothetical protein N0V83_002884 [Neocucurbitaria cava]